MRYGFVSQQEIECAAARMELSDDLQKEVAELRQLIAAMIVSSGGELAVFDWAIHYVKGMKIATERQDHSQRTVFRVTH